MANSQIMRSGLWAAPRPKFWAWLVASLALLFALTALWGWAQARSWPWIVARNAARERPGLSLTPVPLDMQDVSPATAFIAHNFGYHFTFSRKPTKSLHWGLMNLYAFPGAFTIASFNPEEDVETFSFDEIARAMDMTPARLSPLVITRGAPEQAQLLNLKDIELMSVGSISAIYSIRLGHSHGFQFGDPARDKIIALHIFDADSEHFHILITAKNSGAVTQGEVDQIIVSVNADATPAQ
jgi:hypothetical protein